MNINNTIKKLLLKDNQNITVEEVNFVNRAFASDNEKLFRKYEDLFKHLHMNKNSGYIAPHKPVLLLSIMQLIAEGKIESETIIFDQQIKSEFLNIWGKYVNKSTPFSPTVKTPFIHLESEPFWNTVDSRTAIIDKELYDLMKDGECRVKLQELLIDIINSGINKKNIGISNCMMLITELIVLGAIA